MKTKLIVISFLVIGGLSLFLNAVSGTVMFMTTMKYDRDHTAWLAADACLTEADANINTHPKHKGPKPEVVAVHALDCIAHARSIVK